MDRSLLLLMPPPALVSPRSAQEAEAEAKAGCHLEEQEGGHLEEQAGCHLEERVQCHSVELAEDDAEDRMEEEADVERWRTDKLAGPSGGPGEGGAAEGP